MEALTGRASLRTFNYRTLQGRTTKGAHGAPGRRRLRDELPFYGTLIYGPRDELPCGSLRYGTEAYMDDDKGSLQDAAAKALNSPSRDGGAYGTSLNFLRTYRTLHREGRQRGLTGRRDEVAR